MSTVEHSREVRDSSVHTSLSEAAVITDPNDHGPGNDQSISNLIANVREPDESDARLWHRADSALRAWTTGRLQDAYAWSSEGIQEATEAKGDVTVEVATLHRVTSATLLEWCDVQRSLTHALAAIRELATSPPSQAQMYAFLQMAATAAAVGHTADALTHLDEARRVALTSTLTPDAQDQLMRDHVAVLLDIGDVEQAQHWLAGLRQHVSSGLEDEALSLRAIAADESGEDIGDRAIRLLKSVQGDASLRTRVEVGTASAVGLEAAGRRNEAMVILSTAIHLGEAERFTWSIARYRRSITSLLEALQDSGPHGPQTWSTTHLERISRAAHVDQQRTGFTTNVSGTAAETLSEREMQVLRLLGGTLSNREIGAELYLSVNTVKTHVKSVYSKLGVNRRAEAVNRARSLGLLRNNTNDRPIGY